MYMAEISAVLEATPMAETRHRVRVNLYPTQLPNAKEPFIARCEEEEVLSIQQLADDLKLRGGYKGNIEDLVDGVNQLIAEAKFQVADGFGVNLGICSVHPGIGGEWTSPDEAHDRKKHPVRFRARIMPEMRKMSETIDLECKGLVPQNGEIDSVTDFVSGKVNSEVTIGNFVDVRGRGLRIAAPKNPTEETGVWAVDETGKATRCALVAVNQMRRLRFVLPAGLTDGKKYRVRVVTYASVRKRDLLIKNHRTMETNFQVTAKTKVVPTDTTSLSPRDTTSLNLTDTPSLSLRNTTSLNPTDT
jgi:hypothetical protein